MIYDYRYLKFQNNHGAYVESKETLIVACFLNGMLYDVGRWLPSPGTNWGFPNFLHARAREGATTHTHTHTDSVWYQILFVHFQFIFKIIIVENI